MIYDVNWWIKTGRVFDVSKTLPFLENDEPWKPVGDRTWVWSVYGVNELILEN